MPTFTANLFTLTVFGGSGATWEAFARHLERAGYYETRRIVFLLPSRARSLRNALRQHCADLARELDYLQTVNQQSGEWLGFAFAGTSAAGGSTRIFKSTSLTSVLTSPAAIIAASYGGVSLGITNGHSGGVARQIERHMASEGC